MEGEGLLKPCPSLRIYRLLMFLGNRKKNSLVLYNHWQSAHAPVNDASSMFLLETLIKLITVMNGLKKKKNSESRDYLTRRKRWERTGGDPERGRGQEEVLTHVQVCKRTRLSDRSSGVGEW